MGIGTDFRWNGQIPLGGQGKQIAAAQDKLGRLQIFYVGINNHILQNFQLQQNGVLWNGELAFSNHKASQVLLVQDLNQQLNLFYIGSDHHIHQNIQIDAASNTWSGDIQWVETASTMAVIRDSGNLLNVVYVATYGGLFHKQQTNAATNEWPANATAIGDVGVKQVCLATVGTLRHLVYINATNDLVRRSLTDAVGAAWSQPTEFGAKAHQVTSLPDSLGFLHIFYADTGNKICHDWQTNVAADAWQGRTPYADAKGKQIAAALNSLNGLEAHYVGTDNGQIWRMLEDTFPNQANNANWTSPPEPRHDGNDKPVRATQIVAAHNFDGRMEIVYIGKNTDLYHDWERITPIDFESNANEVIASRGANLIGVSVTIAISEDMIAAVDSGSYNGFSVQLNCATPAGLKTSLQQYVMGLYGKEVQATINNWPITGKWFVNSNFNMISIPARKIPAGYKLTITLLNDGMGRVTGATFVVVDNTGNQIKTLTKKLKDLGVSNKHIAPIVSFQLNIVGPDNGEVVLFSSGSGTITYTASKQTPLFAVGHDDNGQFGVGDSSLTAETSNIVYTPIPPRNQMPLAQNFNASLVEDH